MATLLPYIPETITVHLGPPSSDADNVSLPFVDYIANVASSEIYPTWDESALRANIYAEVSFALNRIYTEFYRSRGYDFDITSSTTYDQAFIYGRDIFENIARLAAELFDDYIRRQGNVEPLYAQYCNGTTVTCQGLSQWGSAYLAQNGYAPFDILTNYYGNNIELVRNAPVMGLTATVPENLLQTGSAGTDVRLVQVRLNRIGENYPSIPKIVEADGIFSYDTEAAVKAFQHIFGLEEDGIVGKATWYKIQNIYASVKRLSELNSEGINDSELQQRPFPLPEYGDRGPIVKNLQYFLDYLSRFYPTIPAVVIDGIYGDQTRGAVLAAQRVFDLPETGNADEETFRAIYFAYIGIIRELDISFEEGVVVPYGGVILKLGSEAPDVRILQEYLNAIAEVYPAVSKTRVTGYFGTMTAASVRSYQAFFGLPENGLVDAPVWSSITSTYRDITSAMTLREGQYPGYVIGETQEN